MDPIIIFLFSGFVSMSSALSASALNKVPKSEREGFWASNNGTLFTVMVGNLAAATLLFAMAYGFYNLHWALPLSCMFFSFPLAHILIVQRILGNQWGLLSMILPTIASAIVLYIYW